VANQAIMLIRVLNQTQEKVLALVLGIKDNSLNGFKET
jgi:hypothetical protein